MDRPFELSRTVRSATLIQRAAVLLAFLSAVFHIWKSYLDRKIPVLKKDRPDPENSEVQGFIDIESRRISEQSRQIESQKKRLARFRDLNLSEDESRALIFVREVGAIDNSTYRDINHVDTLAASHHLRRLRDRGLLGMKEKGRATYYVSTEQLLSTLRERVPLSTKKDALSTKKDALSTKKPVLSYMEPATPNPNTDAYRQLLEGLPPEAQELLRDLGARSTEPEKLREAIQQLCSFREWTKKDLALILNRRPEHLGHRYLRPMLEQGILEYTIPGNPKDRRQAYRTAQAHRIPTAPEESPDA